MQIRALEKTHRGMAMNARTHAANLVMPPDLNDLSRMSHVLDAATAALKQANDKNEAERQDRDVDELQGMIVRNGIANLMALFRVAIERMHTSSDEQEKDFDMAAQVIGAVEIGLDLKYDRHGNVFKRRSCLARLQKILGEVKP